MRLHIFPAKDKRSATARYRGYLMGEELRRLGMEVEIHDPPTWRSAWKVSRQRFAEFWKHARIFWEMKPDEAAYLVRTVFQIDFAFLVIFFKIILGRKFIFDFDDAIYEKHFGKIRSALLTRLADAVVVANHHLEAWAKKRNANVFIVPTSISYEVFQRFQHQRSQESICTIGWIGNGVNHVKNLRLLVPVFEQLLAEKFLFRFVLIGAVGYKPLYDLFSQTPGLDIEYIDQLDWSDETAEPSAIQRFDIGVMPLVEDEKTSGKSAFKAIEYMACRVPVVISPVGENNFLVADGQNGLLAGSKEEWVKKIHRLWENKELYEKIAENGQTTIRQRYTLEGSAAELTKVIKKIIINK